VARRLRIHAALALNESDLDRRRGSLLVRCGKGGRRREVGMDEWAWKDLQPWIDVRLEVLSARCFASSTGPPVGDRVLAAARADLRRAATSAGIRRRFAPHQLRHARASRWPTRACR
jgi:site-specific recombinase XerC